MKKYIPQLFVAVVVLYLLFLIRPALLGQLGGTFKTHTVPQDYTKLEEFLNSQNQFSRTFWVPNVQRFGLSSAIHPAVSSQTFYQAVSISDIFSNLKKDNAERQLQEASIKYVIVPFDSEGEIFLKDRTYDNNQYDKTISEIKKISWLSEIPGFGRIHVFEVKNPKDHFWTEGTATLSYHKINPTEYSVVVKDGQKGEKLIFTEGYDSGWKAFLENTVITSQPFKKTFNSFVLPHSGNYTLRVYYQPQQWVNKGLWISGITLIFVLGWLFISAYSVSSRNDRPPVMVKV